jgi:hypothetical protein
MSCARNGMSATNKEWYNFCEQGMLWMSCARDVIARKETPTVGASNDTELEKLKKRLQFVLYCIDCFVS